MMLRGKGLWAYREVGLDRAIQIAPQMGATHILYKVGQGETYYPRMARIAQRIREAGLIPFGWMWVLLDEPYAEAQVVRWAFEDGFDGFIFDTESDQCRNRVEQAVELGHYLRDADIDFDRLYNCSFPNMSHHRDLPYDQMNEFCKGGLMPMSYGTFFAPGSDVPPEYQARRVIDEWTYGHYLYWCRRWGYRPAMAPVLGPYHDEYAEVRMSPGEFQIWLDRLAAHGPAFFSIFTAAVINDDLLPLIRACPLGEGVALTPTKLDVEVVSPEVGYLNVRPSPSTERPPITQVEHGTIMESLDPEADVLAKVGRYGQWLRIRTPDGIEAYVAAWYLRLPTYEPVSFGAPTIEPAPVRVAVEVVSPQLGFLNVRPSPSAQQHVLTQVDDQTTLEALESEADVQAKVGQEDEWLHVRTPDGFEGFVPAQYLRLPERHPVSFGVPAPEAIPPVEKMQLRVVPPKAGYLNVWQTPSTEWPPIKRLYDEGTVKALEPEADVRTKVGQEGQWLHVLTTDGVAGFVQARHLRLPEPPPVSFGVAAAEAALAAGMVVTVGGPEMGYLNVWQTPSTEQPPVKRVYGGDTLEALEPEADVQAKVGQAGEWLHVRTSDGIEGYVPAQHLRLPERRLVSFAVPTFEPPSVEAEAKLQVEVVSPEVGYLNIRPWPSTDRPPTTRVYDGDMLEALGPEERVRAKVGREGEWLYIRTPDGTKGYAAAWYLRLRGEPAAAGIRVKVVSPEAGYLNVRPTPSTDRPPVARANDGDALESLEPEADTRAQVGQKGLWLHIRTLDGIEGYVAAWYLSLDEEVAEEEEEVTGEHVRRLTVHSSAGLNVRRGAGTHTPITWHVRDGTMLEVLDDPAKAGAKLGKDRWLKIGTPSLHEGYVNGLYVKAKRLADKRMLVNDASLPYGESAWIFGIHAADSSTPADFRFLFKDKHKTGWVLFTEGVGTNPYHSGGHDYTPWSHDGYGVIVRLNHSYEPGGTLPVRAKYGDFARACVRFVRNSQACHIWIIGNEQNNVREHPGGAANPIEHITPQMYAEVFNLVRRRIKAVQPEAVVVPGAVDPYNTYPWAKLGGLRTRPLEYFKEMLSHIEDLDGIALHTYTHWLDVGLISKPSVFQDVFLQPGTPYEHYYDFLAYRTFAEAIPEKWRDRPIYITESNHWLALERQPRNQQEEGRIGWVNKDVGWAQAAYAEINRWNGTSHAQQIHCLLLYRWKSDEWAIENKREIHKDFRKALNHDYRWRR